VVICDYCGREIKERDFVRLNGYNLHEMCYNLLIVDYLEAKKLNSSLKWWDFAKSELLYRRQPSKGINYETIVTKGVLNEIPTETIIRMLEIARKFIDTKINLIVFSPYVKDMTYEDEGRTLKYPTPELPKKCYAKLDDFGSPEELSKNIGYKVNTQYVLTLMLAEEY